MKFAIVDIETTGEQQKDLKIIEIAIILHDGQKQLDSFHTFVDPEEKISPFISRLTGIRDSDVAGAPKFYEIARQIIDFVEGAVFVAHNVSFDYGVIRREYRRLGYDFRMNHLCTIQTSRIIFPGHDSYGLKNITRALGIDLNKHHRAIDDALATAELFRMLARESTDKLERFIKHEIDPGVLHPNLDIGTYDDVPNKTGIYRFFDENNELIYIGKSIHIKTRVGQHLKNTKTAKAVEMRQRIAAIEHDVTGSELIALLVESEEIKRHQPVYNRAQRNTQFSHGLYAFTDQKGFINLQVKKNNLTEKPLITFTSVQRGRGSLEYWLEEYKLCQKLCHLHDSRSGCFHYSIKQCKGACVDEETPEEYNTRVQELIGDLNFNGDSFLILDKGRNSKEYGFVWVDEGEYRGYGYIMRYMLKRNPSNFRKFVQIRQTNRDFQSIIKLQVEKNGFMEIIPL